MISSANIIYLGRFVAITNVRSSTVINASTTSNTSRGIIPLTLLKQETFDPTEWKHVIESTECENFNVLFGDLSLDIPEICKYSSETRELVKISDGGVYSLANSDLQLDKQRKGKKLIRDLLSTNSLTESSLFSVLKNDERFSEDAEDFTKWPIFVRCNKTRGTVSSTVLMLDYEGKVEFIERSWTESGELKQESRETFAIE